MNVEVEILTERDNAFTTKRGKKVEQTVLACIDRTAGPRFVNTFDYVLTEEEREKHRGKLEGKRVTLGLIDARPAFGGRLEFQGSITKVQ